MTEALGHDPFAGPAISTVAPTTEPQREIWTAIQMSDEASLSYNESVTLWMKGSLDLDALGSSFSEVTERHEALRSTFSADGLAMVVNVAGTQTTSPVVLVDASGRGSEDVQAEWQRLLDAEVTQPFDLCAGPLTRVTVFRVGPDEHRVVFTAHHIVCDGWSAAVVVRDWAALYSAKVGGAATVLDPPDTYSAYSREQTDAAHLRTAERDEAYWVARFADGVPVLELPVDRPRPPLKTFSSRREDVVLDGGLVRELRRVGGAEKASLFAVLLAGFQAILTRLSGQDDVVVGVPAAGQSTGGHENLVGHCVNMLPMRARVDQERSFRALLADTRNVVLEGYEHQQYTFGSLLRRLPLTRDASRLPLVSVVFNLDRGLRPEQMRFEGLATALTTNPRLFENFDVFVNAVEAGGQITLECQYNTDLFDRVTIVRWLKAYEALLRSVSASADERVGRLRVLTEEDAARLEAWNEASSRPLPEGARVHDLIEAQAAATPAAVAVEAGGVGLTYAELNARANGLAVRLRALGAARGSLVGLCVERSVDMVVGVVGILKSGAAYVPLDPAYPADRIGFMVRDSRMQVLVTQTKLRAELPIDAPHVIEIDAVESSATTPASGPADATEDDPAYVIYTSGSTGVPKGVLVPHRAVVNILTSVREEPGMTSEDVVLAVTTLSFDIAVSEILLPLTVGAKIALASREVASDGHRLLALMHASKATFLDATPATWRLLLAAGWKGGEGLKAICTGEAMPRDVGSELLKRCASVWNGYGPTENTVWSTFWQAREPLGRVLIGKPVANTHLYVLDARMQRVPVGVVGELFIGGAGVTLGYHERDELTRERFLPDPHRGPGARMYKTGDLVRYLSDGNLECLGRNDSQVKIRGYRIELGEIENVLSQHPSIAQATALAREDRPGDVRLVAYAAMKEGLAATDAELRAHLKKTLPDYMVPQIFVRLDRMPLLPNGKIDRKKLPAPQAGDRGADDAFVAPRTPLEQTIAKLWEEVLAVGRVGVHDDFFALGGHSLLASQVIARLRRDHGVEVSFRKMFEAPTIEKLASALEGLSSSQAAPEAPIAQRPASETVPLSISQRRMWLLEEMDPAQRLVHNLCASWRLEGKLDFAALQAALDAIVQRHDTLRTNLRFGGAEPVQVVHAERSIPIRFVDLTSVPEAERPQALADRRDARALELFDLAVDPLLRVTLFKLADETHLLSTVQHNIVWDGWSFDLFLAELSALYGAFSKGLPSPLAPLPIAYGDFAVWQREWTQGPEFEKQATFWRNQLANAKRPLEVPTDRPRRGSRSHGGASEGIHIPLARAEALTAMAREHRATLFMVVFAAFNVLLHRVTGQRELLVGTPVRARTRPELEGLIGPFVNAVALKTSVDPSMRFVDLLEHVRDLTLDAFGNQEVPLDALGDHAPMLRALFSLQDARTRPVTLGDLRMTQDHALAPVAANEMMLWAMESRTDMLLMLNFATELFDPATARRFLRQMEVLFEEVERDPRQKIGSIPLLPPEERAAIATASGVVAATSENVISVLRRVTARAPNANAIVCGDRTISYSELLRRVDGLTRDLVARSVTTGTAVGIEGVAGEDRVISALAVLAAGGQWTLGGGPTPAVVIDGAQARHVGEGDAALVAPPTHAIAWIDDGRGITQAALVRAVEGLCVATGIGLGEIVATSARLDEATSIVSVLTALVAGATLALPSSDSAEALSAVVARTGASTVMASAGAWRTLPLAGPKVVVFGVPPSALLKRFTDAGVVARVVYVPPASGLPASVSTLMSAPERRRLGRPLSGIAWSVEDAYGQPSPIGVPGELSIRTAEETIRTGERVRLRVDGEFEHEGRVDGQVEISGRLVDLVAIARAIESHPAVSEAFVDVREDLAGEPRIVSYFATREGESCTETELRSRARAAVGERGTPRFFVEVDALPRDAAREVVQTRLPSPYAISGVHQHVAPRTEPEKYVANVWKEALGVARIGVYDNFFDLGGHSLLCFRVIARIEADTQKRISPRLMLLNTLEHVAGQLDGAMQNGVTVAKADAGTPARATTQPERPFAARVLKRLKGLVRG